MTKYLIILVVVFYGTIISQEVNNYFSIPPRPPDAKTGSEFMESIKSMTFEAREEAIKNELLAGNVPDFLRTLIEINAVFSDLNGNSHNIKYWVMADYLCIGNDSDFCRIPMGPITAQTVADVFGAVMPTRKLVDNIYINSTVKLAPVTYAPVGNENEKAEKFILHNSDIQKQFNSANGVLGELTGGTKKDVVLSNKITDPNRPKHVTIYGWHQLNGQPIQPLTNIHYDYYVDYSHGIRFIRAVILLDDDTVKVTDILKDDILYKVLSDESGSMSQPSYIIDNNIPSRPRSFGIRSDNEGEIKIILKPEDNVEKHELQYGKDGRNFNSKVEFTGNEIIIGGLSPDSIFFFRLTAINNYGVSQPSEVSGAIPNPSSDKILVVNGFDRSSDGNSYDFIVQHGSAIYKNDLVFESATNDALTDGLMNVNDYKAVVFILGNESTADETFSDDEQVIIRDYLEKGGNLFLSGSEIAWDLDYKGKTSDKNFIYNYFKAKYSADAPGGKSGSYYSAEGVTGEIFDDITAINFDNGSHGTYNVNYADALLTNGGSSVIVTYKNVTTHNIGGVKYEGTVGTGAAPARIVFLGFPFETVYPEETRTELMKNVMDFFFSAISDINDNYYLSFDQYRLYQNFPNPFNPTTKISYSLPEANYVKLTVYDILGREIKVLLNENKPAGNHEVDFDASDLTSGAYIYRITAGNFQAAKQMIFVK